jgi:hypothetical protein
MLVNGHQRDQSFQRKTGYVQQLDLHLETSTVREALLFSAFLRQPYDVSREEKIRYVDEVIKMLEIEEYSDAVVGVQGEGTALLVCLLMAFCIPVSSKRLILTLHRPECRTAQTSNYWCGACCKTQTTSLSRRAYLRP